MPDELIGQRAEIAMTESATTGPSAPEWYYSSMSTFHRMLRLYPAPRHRSFGSRTSIGTIVTILGLMLGVTTMSGCSDPSPDAPDDATPAAPETVATPNAPAATPDATTDARPSPDEPTVAERAPKSNVTTLPRYDDYIQARNRATGWLDALEVNAPTLDTYGINGIKKLSEQLWAYKILHDHVEDPVERKRLKERARAIVAQTADPEYHTLDVCSTEEFNERILPYLLVARLTNEFGFDVSTFRYVIDLVESRVRRDMLRRGRRPRLAAADLYRGIGLEPVDVLLIAPPSQQTVLARRLSASAIGIPQGYELTHEVYLAFDYGHRRVQDYLSEEDIAYLLEVIPPLIDECINRQFPDLLAELLSCMIYLGQRKDPTAVRALNYLLDTQNENGTWGNYEILRAQYGAFVDQKNYLHTVQVTLRALCESYEGRWAVQEAVGGN